MNELYYFILIVGIITMALSVVLKTKRVLFFQLLLSLSIYVFEDSLQNWFYILLIVFQILLILLVLYRLKKAIDYNYKLVLEKTHRIPPNITLGGNTGRRSSFF